MLLGLRETDENNQQTKEALSGFNYEEKVARIFQA